jgi:excinuclease UvrABC ATPase subunit
MPITNLDLEEYKPSSCDCEKCGGSGQEYVEDSDNGVVFVICSACKGTGLKNNKNNKGES